MTITYAWTFPFFETIPVAANGLKNVVAIVHWTYTAQSGTGDSITTAKSYGTFNLPTAEPDLFIPYEDITFQMTVNWANAMMDVPALEASLANEINQQLNPVNIALPPFSS
jgi:hypothetical protein